jgi:hypothetical protein
MTQAGKTTHPNELDVSSEEKLSDDHDEGEFGDDEMEQDEPRYSVSHLLVFFVKPCLIQ